MITPVRQKIFFAAVLLLVLPATACDEPGQASIYGYSGPRNICVDNSDCTEGDCHITRKVCVVSQQSSTELYARITFDSPVLKPQLIKVPMTSTDSLSVQVKEPVVVQMLTPAAEIDADVLFFDLSNTLPGDDPDVSVYKTYLDTSASTAATAATSDSLFSLLPGMYDIAVYPVGNERTTHPVSTFKNIEIDSQGNAWDGDNPLESIFPEKQNTLSGKVYYFSSVEGDIEAKYLTVQAYEPEGGRVLSHAFELFCVAGTSASGAADCGNFSIPLPAGTESVSLRFFKPNESFFPAYVRQIDDLNFSGGVAKEQIVLDPLETPIAVTGKVSVNPIPNGNSPAPICRVLIEMADSDDRTLEYWVYTNGYGEIERAAGLTGVYLYPGRYRVRAFPMTDISTLSQTYAQIELSDTLVVINPEDAESIADEENIAINHFSLQLEPGINVLGTVTYNGAPIPGTVLTAYNIEELYPFNNQLTTRTRADGKFDMWVDNTLYYVITNPPNASGFATGFHIWNIPKTKTLDAFAAEVKVPFAIEGNLVVTPNSSWFADVEPDNIVIEWHRQFGQSAYRVHRSRVGADYFFSALLPPI